MDKENKYKLKMMEIIEKRLHALWDNTGFTLIKDPLRVGYYTEIDMLVWAKKFYGDDFVEHLKRTYSPLNVVFRLAKETSLVLLNGGGFDGPEWSIRASLAYYLLDPGMKVTYIAEDDNIASVKIAEKVGFTPGTRELRVVCRKR